MEAEMAECNRRLEGTEDAEMRAVLMSLLEINSNILCVFHQNQGTLGKQEAPTERKKLCLERGLVEKSCVDCIRDVFSPLPVIVELARVSSENNSASVPVLFNPPESKKGADNYDKEMMTKCVCHRNQIRHPTSLRSTFRVHRHPSRWTEPQEKDRI